MKFLNFTNTFFHIYYTYQINFFKFQYYQYFKIEKKKKKKKADDFKKKFGILFSKIFRNLKHIINVKQCVTQTVN